MKKTIVTAHTKKIHGVETHIDEHIRMVGKPKLGDGLYDNIMEELKDIKPQELPSVKPKPFRTKKELDQVFGWSFFTIPGSKIEFKARTTDYLNLWEDPKNQQELDTHLKALKAHERTDNLGLAYGVGSSKHSTFNQWGEQLCKFKGQENKETYYHLLMLGTKKFMKYCENLPEKVQDISIEQITELQHYFQSISVSDIEYILKHSGCFTYRGLLLLKGHPFLGKWREEILSQINQALVAMK